jgi:hypothetical protein
VISRDNKMSGLQERPPGRSERSSRNHYIPVADNELCSAPLLQGNAVQSCRRAWLECRRFHGAQGGAAKGEANGAWKHGHSEAAKSVLEKALQWGMAEEMGAISGV